MLLLWSIACSMASHFWLAIVWSRKHGRSIVLEKEMSRNWIWNPERISVGEEGESHSNPCNGAKDRKSAGTNCGKSGTRHMQSREYWRVYRDKMKLWVWNIAFPLGYRHCCYCILHCVRVLTMMLAILLSSYCTIIIIIMYIYHALINALSAHMIHINLNMIFYTLVEHSPTKTIYIKYYKNNNF